MKIICNHIGMIPILREFVKMLFKQKLIAVVFATETLAHGIDMPARIKHYDLLKRLDQPFMPSATS
jgi:ATP-dependent RNA helicase HelY